MCKSKSHSLKRKKYSRCSLRYGWSHSSILPTLSSDPPWPFVLARIRLTVIELRTQSLRTVVVYAQPPSVVLTEVRIDKRPLFISEIFVCFSRCHTEEGHKK